MGAAAAIAFAREGADVVINYLPDEQPDADHILGQIAAGGTQGRSGSPAICATPPSAAIWSSRRSAELGGLDLLVSNAARQQTAASILDIIDEDFDATIKTNIYAPFWLIKAALPHLQARLEHHRHDLRTGDRSLEGPVRLCDDQGRDDELHPQPRQAAWRRRASASTALRRARSGPRSRCRAARRWRSSNSSAGRRRSGGPGQPGELGGIYVRLAENDGSYATGQVYGAMGGGGLP